MVRLGARVDHERTGVAARVYLDSDSHRPIHSASHCHSTGDREFKRATRVLTKPSGRFTLGV
jgi:hypothetical protein